MMTAELVVPDITIDLASMSLNELGVAATHEFENASKHLTTALWHIVALGEILCVAREQVEDGQWMAWLRSIGIGNHKSAANAMRLAHYRDHLPPEAFQPWRGGDGRMWAPSWNRALIYLKGLPDTNKRGAFGGWNTIDPTVKTEAKRLVRSGMSHSAVAATLGVGTSWVSGVMNPDAMRGKTERDKAVRRRRKAAMRALIEKERREERDRLARTATPDVSHAYALVRQALAAMDRSIGGVTPDARTRLVEALRLLHRAEDRIVEAMQSTRDGVS